jgi:transcriptional regulator with PAS, ATPase and Fis domain
VLLLGETGTGKEMVARAIHRLSPRSSRPFVAVNCGALPDTLLESELFGYKAGAFTGALRNKPGRFAIAHDGTVFLDEIGDMSPALQVKLLRVLQSKTYEPLGGTGTETTEARILAATNRDLPSLVRQSSFRSDLYYRINVVRLELPPLRERREDIPALVDQLVARFNRASSRGVTGVSQESMAVLLAHDFPGNIRELENIIEHAFVLCPGGPIELDHLPEEMRRPSVAAPPSSTLGSAVKSQEAIAIMEALQRNDFNRLAAARELGIHKSTLFRKLKALGLDLPEVDGRYRSK